MAPKQNLVLAAPRMSSSNRGVINTCLRIIRVPNIASGLICSSTDSAELQTKEKKTKLSINRRPDRCCLPHHLCSCMCRTRMEVCHLLSASIVSKAIMNDSKNPYKEASSLLRIAIISSRDVLMICFVLSRRQRTSHCSNWMKFLDECL